MKSIKRIVSIFAILAITCSALLLSSCDEVTLKDTVESFLTSESYTYESGKTLLMVYRETVYLKKNDTEHYLYYDEDNLGYYYCVKEKDKEIVKHSLDSEMYILQYQELVADASATAATLSAILHAKEFVGEENKDCRIKLSDKITCELLADEVGLTIKVGANKTEIYGIDDTEIEIPGAVMKAKPQKVN